MTAVDSAVLEELLPTTPIHLLALPGVYRPQHDTGLMARALRREAIPLGSEVLELGTGTGALAILAARAGARVTAVDISRRAVFTARVNARLARERIEVKRCDLTADTGGRTFDMVISNPPYVPSPSARLPRRGVARAWDAGRDGRTFIDRICATVPTMLRPAGALLMVHSAVCGTEATLNRLAEAGMCGSVVDRAFVPLGPVMRSRREWLRHQGILGDEPCEELVIIRAEHA
ncbi:HemK2/MTQ2 family protein methyltransferase [Streptomyces beijiangensis]|uniref:Methyltransferase n=1 Tax=Streptomyces beijiangensis TaxID=163361 RepID=A0A939JMS7_9ACTN|nr:HemK2/MTQ2 family protein methyltransferase [Streptomyces beijiangensis]MBO0517099.1 methyltransferase [Streptomyces beijiangensis]